MNSSFNVVLILITIPKSCNLDQWNKLTEDIPTLYKSLESKFFTKGGLKKQYYVESHQITLEFLGDFLPANEEDLVCKYTNNKDFITSEVKAIVDQELKATTFKLEIGVIKAI